MQHKLRKLVLVLMLTMAVASPFMQLDSWDMFPTATDDLELRIIMNLCVLGMFFVLATVLLKLFPVLFTSPFLARSTASLLPESEVPAQESALFGISPPLRN
jgi:hypothetical protein